MFGKFFSKSILTVYMLFFLLASCSEAGKSSFKFDEKDDLLKRSIWISKNDLSHKKTYSNVPVDSLNAFLCKMNAFKAEYPRVLNAQMADSLSRSIFFGNKLYITDDKVLVSDSFLIRNADLAITAWKESEWHKNVDFNQFCDYILPYKLSSEAPDHWRDSLYQYHQKLIVTNSTLKNLDSLYQYHLSNTYHSLSSSEKFSGIYKSVPNYSWITISGEGDCSLRCRFTMYHLRAAGAPATYDYIPHWGNRAFAIHSYVGLANKSKQYDKLIENNNDPFNLINDLNAAMTVNMLQEFINEDVPQGLYVQYEKTIPKIYRETWSDQDNMTELLGRSHKSEVDFNLIKPNMIDVTRQYINCSEFSFSKNIFDPYCLAYLAVFDIKGWYPVAFSEFSIFGNAKFENIGKNIIYLPVAKKNEEIIPLSNPFSINSLGVIKEYQPDFDSLINMNLIRKYPLFAYSAKHAFSFKGCVIQGSDDAEFRNFVNLDTIRKPPFFELKIDLSGVKKFQYYRLWSEGKYKLAVKKFLFYMLDENNCTREIKRELTRKGNLLYARIDTICNIDHLIIWPRNDENFIVSGNKYELFYWDGKWVSAGVTETTGFGVNYSNIPSETIYWLKCLSGGKEERIFTYENGKQVWW